MTQPKPAAKRALATWTVFEVIEHANVEVLHQADNNQRVPVGRGDLEDVAVLVVRAESVVRRSGADACWAIVEQDLRDRAQGDDPPVLCASRNGTAHGLTEARPYALKATVERVK